MRPSGVPMEPYVVPFHLSSPPPLDDDGDGEAGPEDDGFGDFGGFCSSRGGAGPAGSSSTLREPSRTLKAAAQSQTPPTPSSGSGGGRIQTGRKDLHAGSALPLTNGYAGGDQGSPPALPPREETGFADFTVFTEQEAPPWCCGLAPSGGAEPWAGQIRDPAREVVLDSEPRPHCASGSKGSAKVQHREKRDASQDPGGVAGRGDRWRETGHCLSYLQTSEEQEDGDMSAVPRIISAYESEELDSVGDDFSFEGVSADLEPIVSSLASQDDQTDGDQTDAEDEDLGPNWRSDSCGPSATQETSATSNQPLGPAGLDGSERHGDQGRVQTAAVSLGGLPPSDSFADFCSAPTQEGGEGSWAEFSDHRRREEGPDRGAGGSQPDGNTEDEQDRVGRCGHSRRNSCQVSLSCRVQKILCASFPEVGVPTEEEAEEEEEEEEEVLSLCAHLHSQQLPQSEEQTPEPSGARWVQPSLWWPRTDVHSAVGLQFQWGGSHANRTLLRCLGVDTRNIVFIGLKKQPIAVPAFASSLGMLKPTKDSVPGGCASGHPAVPAPGPAGPQDKQEPPPHLVQEAPPSSRGLSSSQDDGGCALNLDCFGPEEQSGSGSSSPPPGVDRELYELTISKLETSTDSCHLVDTLNRLMSEAERTITSVRKPPEDEELSAEAGQVITELPNLSFMTAKVLMFPSVLVPTQ